MRSFLRRWWGVPVGLVCLLVFTGLLGLRAETEQTLRAQRYDRAAAAHARAIAGAQRVYHAQQGRFTENVADLVEVDRSGALDRGVDKGLRAELTVSQSGKTVLVRVRGARHVHTARLP